MYWKQYILIFIIALFITAIEIFLDYLKGHQIALKSKFFLFLFIFNIIVAYLLFFFNTDGGLKFLNISNPWLLSLVSGTSGFFLFNSKFDLEKIEKDYEWSGVKSIGSCIKTKLNGLTREYVEKEYPFKLITYLKENINDVKDYSNFVRDVVDHFSNEEMRNKFFELINRTNQMECDDMGKIYYLTKILMQIKDPHWIKKNVVHKFCNIEKIMN